MPKHALTFKHLIATSSTPSRSAPERSVNDLLSSSRRARPQQDADNAVDAGGRGLPPHLRGQRVWTPSSIDLALEIDSGAVHPGELLRREQEAHRAAARSVAGPAPPRSWRPATTKRSETDSSSLPERSATTYDFLSASETLGQSIDSPWPLQGAPRLVDCCIGLVLKLLHNPEVLNDEDGGEQMTLGEAVLETTRELDLRFRDLLIRRAALLPQGDPLRLSDRQIRGLLEYDPGVRGGRRPDPGEEDDDWDSPENGDMITHLALTAHPSPIPLLRDVPRLQALALTSLDLAYCTLPADLDRLVTVLPSGLRALGLRGVRAPTSPDVMKLWPHGMGSLGRKLVVLRTLDLSEFPVNSAAPVHLHLGSGPNEEWHLGVHPLLALLKPLLQPAGAHLPSLRVLRLAGILDEPPDTSTLHSSRLYLHEDQTRKNRMTTDRVSEMLKSGGERSHWVEVQWE